MKQWWKVMLSTLCVLVIGTVTGCGIENKENVDYSVCNISSGLRMAETEEGYFYAYNGLLFYADKEDLHTWVPVCNKPDCLHLKHTGCNAEIPNENIIIQKEGKLYGANTAVGVGETPNICEISMDGSGVKKVYDIPLGEGYTMSGSSEALAYERVLLKAGGLTENGMYHDEIIAVEEDSTYTLYEKDGERSSVAIMTGNGYWGVRGDQVVIVLSEESSMDTLWEVKDGKLQKMNLPDDIVLLDSMGARNVGDLYTYYVPNKGFYQWNKETEEKTLLFEAQIPNGRGYVLSEQYMVEFNCYYQAETKAEEAAMKFYNGKEWLDVQLPEFMQTEDLAGLAPIGVGTESIFFKVWEDETAKKHNYTTNLYYFMLDDKNPELELAGVFKAMTQQEANEDAKPEEEDETSGELISTGDFEEIIVYDTEEYLVKIVDAKQDKNNLDQYIIDIYAENKSDTVDYDFGADIAVNGIQCRGIRWSASVKAGAKDITQLTLEKSHLKASGILNHYKTSDFTDVALSFEVLNGNTLKQVGEMPIVHIYPQGEENATTYTRQAEENDIVLVNNEYVKIVLTGYSTTNAPNDTMEVFVENKSDSLIDCHFNAKNVNDLVGVSGNIKQNIGSNLNSGVHEIFPNGCLFGKIITIDEETVKKSGIGAIEKIQLAFFIKDCMESNENKLVEDVLTVYPNGEEHAVTYERTPQSTDKILVDNEYVTIVVTGYEASELYVTSFGEFPGNIVNLYMVNKTDKTLIVKSEGNTINGVTLNIGGSIYQTLEPGKRAFDTMVWMPFFLQDKNITAGGEKQFVLRVYEEGKEIGADLVTQKVTLNEEVDTKWYVHNAQKSDIVVVDNDTVSISITKKNQYQIEYYVVNKTEKDLMVDVEKVLLDGVEMEEQNERYLLGNALLYGEIRSGKENFNESEVEIYFRVYPFSYVDGSVGEDVANKTIKLTP